MGGALAILTKGLISSVDTTSVTVTEYTDDSLNLELSDYDDTLNLTIDEYDN